MSLRAIANRLAKLETKTPRLSERAKAWLGMRPALTAEEVAAEPEQASVDPSVLSPQLRAWLGV